MGRKLIEYPFYTIIYLSFLFFIIIPVVYTFGTALLTDNTFTDNLQQLNISIFILLGKSCMVAFVIAFLSTFFGTILGFILYRTHIPFRNFFKIALLIPLFISPYILAVAWKDLFYLFFHNTDFISSNVGVVLVLTFVFTPLSMLITGSAFSNINIHLEETGYVMTSLKNVILKITLPLIKPALLTSFILIFIFGISEFSVPAFFGVKVFTTEIFTQFSAFYNHALAILQASLLIVVLVLLIYADKKYLSDAPFLSVSGKGSYSRPYDLKSRKWFLVSAVFIWFFISVILPFIILLLQSFGGGTAIFIQAFELLKPTFSNSILLAISGALITVVIGFISAYYFEIKNRKSFDWLLLLAFVIPSTIFGISLIKFYNHPFFDFIYSSYIIILIGYIGKFSFISAKLIGNAIKQIPNSLDEAAQIEGIGLFSRIQKILVPLIMPTLLAALLINFIFSLSELGTTIMVYPPGTEIMPVKIFTIMANAPESLTSSMTLIVFSITLIFILAVFSIVKPMIKNYHDADHQTR